MCSAPGGRWVLGIAVWISLPGGVMADETISVVVKVDAGRYNRHDTPVAVELPADKRTQPLREALASGPVRLLAQEAGQEAKLPVQAERTAKGIMLSWILPGETPAGQVRTFRVSPKPEPNGAGPWLVTERPDGLLDVKNGERTVFRYQMAPSSHPNFKPVLVRSGYIHPAFTPRGALITGDFSSFHPHHRGFFLAYTKTQVGDLHPDFWNIHTGTGKIFFDHLETPVVGPLTARFAAHHRWEAKGKVVLKEKWDVALYDIPGQPYWLFDLTATQQATDQPMELVPYRYGGMAYRGAEPFVKGGIDVLTDQGSGRRQRDQKPARWVDLTGPIAEGSPDYAGAMIADHPSNIHHPTVARIHPTTLPFFCYVPAHDKPVTIGTDSPVVFRYRVLIHDGRPDKELDERIWRDFAEPPVVIVEEAP